MWRQCIQDYSTRYRDFHNNESPKERIDKLLYSVTIEHLSKLGKLNEIGKIFLDLFDLNKYTLATTISCMINDVEDIQSFQNNGSELMIRWGLLLSRYQSLECVTVSPYQRCVRGLCF